MALATALIAGIALIAPTPADARVSDAAAVGIGLGAFALGGALGSAPYYGAGYYGYPYGGYGYGYRSYYYPPAYPYYTAPAYYRPYW